MGKNYIENSLKRFLKRKVKITLGFVVAFMITGTVGFAETNPYREETVEYHKWEAEKALQGTVWNGSGINNLNAINGKEDNGYKIIITDDGENTKIKIENLFSNEISIADKYISDNLLENLKNLDSNNSTENINYGITKANTSSFLENNYGIIYGTQKIIDNNGIIFGQQEITREKGYNHGLLIGSGTGVQLISGTAGNITEGYNYGVLIGANRGQVVSGNANGYNYGVIEADTKGQITINEDSKGYNFGYIYTSSQGQIMNSNKGVIGGSTYNFGVISTTNGQNIVNNNGQQLAYNYGVVINSGTQQKSSIYSGKVQDRGIIIRTNNSGVSGANLGSGDINGVVLQATENNGKLTNITYDTNNENNKQKVVDLTDTSDNKANQTVNEVFNSSKDKTTIYTQNTTVDITGHLVGDDLAGKTLTGVVDSSAKDNTTLYKFTGNSDTLVLADTVITGYFQKAGTLLDVTNKKLTLGSGTIINAVEENFGVGATAVQLGDNGTLSIIGKAQVIGKINGGSHDNTLVENIALQDNNGTLDITAEKLLVRNATDDEAILLNNGENYTNIVYGNLNVKEMELSFTTGEDKVNIIKIAEDSKIGKIDGSKSEKQIELTINDTEEIGNIILGKKDDKLNLINSSHDGIIDMGEGNDEINLTMNGSANHDEKIGNIFDYQVENTEKIVLNGEGWHIGNGASIVGGKETSTTAGDRQATEINIAAGSLHVDMNNNFGNGKVSTSLDKMASEGDLSVTTGTKDDTSKGTVKFTVGEEFNVADKQFDIAHDYNLSDANLGAAVIFKGTGANGKVEEDASGKITLTVKEASEFGLDNYKGIYDAVLGALSDNPDLREAVNYQNEDKLIGMITDAGKTADTFYTTGYAVTKDVADTYISVVEDFGRKAGKGEWIAYGKYVNSDTEFDEGNKSKGYDGEITGTVGMIEYGVDDVTSYGVVYGQGDTEVDITEGGKLDGDNTYFGGYIKHRTEKGVDLIGNIGYTESELELDLVSQLKGTALGEHTIITDGKSDADALTLSLRGKKDYRISDSVILQPVASVRYSFINQDEVTSSDASYKMDAQDITIFEGSLGANLVREFELNNGKLALSVGAEYIITDVNKSDNARYTLYEKDIELTGEDDIADSKTEAHIGAEYIHENGVGFDVKYEAVFTNKGDSDRITAGMSYSF